MDNKIKQFAIGTIKGGIFVIFIWSVGYIFAMGFFSYVDNIKCVTVGS